ncbi:hypothetical protein SAMN06264365_111133 [Actinoplanes regularis]|uniref:Uncharacterized protein n=1 Tax=Actinoplanes regularis TaxID=52697 RepID=A0A239CFE8_9ACTN|nr:hypothetical protein Are01nite_59160 [Actinoplanes regularis]SNS18398.1 hypothetical protein SAMN06264365_111133 [Actinoplanes regularis]
MGDSCATLAGLMRESCAAAAVLRAGGPVRVPFRECCAAALFGVGALTAVCRAVEAGSASADPADDGPLTVPASPGILSPGPARPVEEPLVVLVPAEEVVGA